MAATGTTFDHAVGVGPFTLADSTTVQQREPPRLLKMLVRARPLTQAVVTLQLRRAAEGTQVVMEEHPADLRSRILFNPLVQPLVHVRNAESLRRLKALAEGSEPIPDGALPPRRGVAEGAVTVTGSSRPASP